MKKRLTALAGAAAGAGLLWLALRGLDLGALASSFARADARVALPVLLLDLLELYFRSLRWRLLLAPSTGAGLADAFRLEASALALNNLLPLRLGEAVRGAWGASRFNAPAATVFATMAVERAMDAAALTLLFLGAVALGGGPAGLGGVGQLWLLPAGLLAALAALAFGGGLARRGPLAAFVERFPAAAAFGRRLSQGAAALRSPGAAAAAAALALLQWLVNALNIWLIARAFGLGPAVGPARSLSLLFAGAVSVSLPGLPGYFGNFEFALARTLGGWGVPPDAAFAYAALSHILSYAVFTGAGLVCLYSLGQSPAKVWRRFSGAAEVSP